MYGFTTTRSGIRFDQALTRTLEAPKGEGFDLLSDIDVDATEWLLRSARARMADDGTPERAV